MMTSEGLSELTAAYEARHGKVETTPIIVRSVVKEKFNNYDSNVPNALPYVEFGGDTNRHETVHMKVRDYIAANHKKGITSDDVMAATGASRSYINRVAKMSGFQLVPLSNQPKSKPKRPKLDAAMAYIRNNPYASRMEVMAVTGVSGYTEYIARQEVEGNKRPSRAAGARNG